MDYSIPAIRIAERKLEGNGIMIFFIFKGIADLFESHFSRGLIMSDGVLSIVALFVFLTRTAFCMKKRFLRFLSILFCVLLLPQVFAMASFVEFRDKSITPELLGVWEGETVVLENMLVPGKDGFILTDLPPAGTCTRGDYALEELDSATQNMVLRQFPLDCETYSYLFVRGMNKVIIQYTTWCNGLSWYLGAKGFYRSFEGAGLQPCADSSGNPEAIYVFRFRKQYIQLSELPFPSGKIDYLFFHSVW